MSEVLGAPPPVEVPVRVPVLRGRGLGRTYRMGGKPIRVLDDIDLELSAGESVAITGRSGVGKSTLLHLLGLLDRPDEGTLELGGVETSRLSAAARARLRHREIGFVFQFYHLIHELNALENVLLALRLENGNWWRRRGECRARALALLAEIGLADRARHRPTQLSGGERQRVAIARALLAGPRLLLCDEPTGNLDERTSAVIADMLFDLAARRGVTLVLVTHDPDLAARADRRVLVHEGRLEPIDP